MEYHKHTHKIQRLCLCVFTFESPQKKYVWQHVVSIACGTLPPPDVPGIQTHADRAKALDGRETNKKNVINGYEIRTKFL